MVLATEAGTPFFSRHWVNWVREALVLGVVEELLAGVVVVAPALALVVPPHAVARTATAPRRRRSMRSERFGRDKRRIWFVTLNSSHRCA